MSKIVMLLFLAFLAALGFFAIDNKDMVMLKVPFGSLYEMPKIALIVMSTTIGALLCWPPFLCAIRSALSIICSIRSGEKRGPHTNALFQGTECNIGRQKEEAKEALDEMLKEAPEHIDALLRLGDIALSNDDSKAAFDYYKKARDINRSDLQVLLSLEKVMEKMKRFDDSMKYLDEILDIDAGNLTALCRKRDLLEMQDKWDDLLLLQKSIIKLEQNEKDKEREEHRLLGYKYEYARSSLENGELKS